MGDLALLTGASIVKKNDIDDIQVGSLSSIKITKTNAILVKNDFRDVSDRIKTLKEYINNTSDKNEKRLTQQRIEILDGKIAEILVGGDSEIEMKETKDRVDDAVLAVKSALEEGIIYGGGVGLFKCSNHDLPFYISIPLESCFDYLGKIIDKTIIDPKKVTRVALENAASVALTLSLIHI